MLQRLQRLAVVVGCLGLFRGHRGVERSGLRQVFQEWRGLPPLLSENRLADGRFVSVVGVVGKSFGQLLHLFSGAEATEPREVDADLSQCLPGAPALVVDTRQSLAQLQAQIADLVERNAGAASHGLELAEFLDRDASLLGYVLELCQPFCRGIEGGDELLHAKAGDGALENVGNAGERLLDTLAVALGYLRRSVESGLQVRELGDDVDR